MQSPGYGPLRAIRTAFLAGACAGLSWSGHALWADTPASPAAAPVAAVLLTPLLAALTRRQRGFGEIFAVLAASQVALHLVFLASAPESPALAEGHAGHGLAGYFPGMLAAHLWAALLAAALLARGEAALWSLLALLGAALPSLAAPATVPAPAGTPPCIPEPPPLRPGGGAPRRDRSRAPPVPVPTPTARPPARLVRTDTDRLKGHSHDSRVHRAARRHPARVARLGPAAGRRPGPLGLRAQHPHRVLAGGRRRTGHRP
ncbi:copper resistance protein [Nocardiopsis sediminis]|uniref:Copper resistance protein n=1 Tax=Nocardiopsis sediminis TaxID=1778267 RepID=A0ABV8FV61_9ACTN